MEKLIVYGIKENKSLIFLFMKKIDADKKLDKIKNFWLKEKSEKIKSEYKIARFIEE